MSLLVLLRGQKFYGDEVERIEINDYEAKIYLKDGRIITIRPSLSDTYYLAYPNDSRLPEEIEEYLVLNYYEEG